MPRGISKMYIHNKITCKSIQIIDYCSITLMSFWSNDTKKLVRYHYFTWKLCLIDLLYKISSIYWVRMNTPLYAKKMNYYLYNCLLIYYNTIIVLFEHSNITTASISNNQHACIFLYENLLAIFEIK